MKLTCKHCGGDENLNFSSDVNERLVAVGSCHTCNFWIERAEHPHPYRLITSEYYHMIGEPASPAVRNEFRGCSGRNHRITMTDGREYHSNDVWHQGSIPGHLRHLFTPNVSKMRSA